MSTHHTPGPWTTYEHSRGIDVIVDDGADGIDVATVRNPADARLIAAAPTMLQALQSLADAVNQFVPLADDWPELTAARAAIARATGNV